MAVWELLSVKNRLPLVLDASMQAALAGGF